jgi:hypothetical protein
MTYILTKTTVLLVVFFAFVLPAWILQLFLGINMYREEDLFTWALDTKDLGIYDPINAPYTNQFEIPEGYEQWVRHFDTGAVYSQERNKDFANIIDEEVEASVKQHIIYHYYRDTFPEEYEGYD